MDKSDLPLFSLRLIFLLVFSHQKLSRNPRDIRGKGPRLKSHGLSDRPFATNYVNYTLLKHSPNLLILHYSHIFPPFLFYYILQFYLIANMTLFITCYFQSMQLFFNKRAMRRSQLLSRFLGTKT